MKNIKQNTDERCHRNMSAEHQASTVMFKKTQIKTFKQVWAKYDD